MAKNVEIVDNNHVSSTVLVSTYQVIKSKLMRRKSLGDIKEYIYILVEWFMAGRCCVFRSQRLGFFTSSPLALVLEMTHV